MTTHIHPLVRGIPNKPRYPSPAEEAAQRPLLEEVLSLIENDLPFLLRDTGERGHQNSRNQAAVVRLRSLLTSVSRLGWYERAQALVERIKASPIPEHLRHIDWEQQHLGIAQMLRGDFDELLKDPKPFITRQGIGLKPIIEHAMRQRNLALAEPLLASCEDQSPYQRMLLNGDFAILSHWLGEQERVLPALHRARRAMEEVNKEALEKNRAPLDQVFDRPLTEGAEWAELPDECDCLYLVLVFACSGHPDAAVDLVKERDLTTWPNEYNDGLAVCSRLALHGHFEQALALADANVGGTFPLRLLERFVFASALWDRNEEAVSMLDELLRRCVTETSEHAQDQPHHVLHRLSCALSGIERLEMARRVTEAYFVACEARPDIQHDFTGFPLLSPASQARVRASLPERLRTSARQNAEELKDGMWFGDSPETTCELRFHASMANLGLMDAEPEKIAALDIVRALEVHKALLNAGNNVDAERLLPAIINQVRDVDFVRSHARHRVSQRLYELGRFAEGESILWLVDLEGRGPGIHRHVNALVDTHGLQAAFDWIKTCEEREDRLEGWIGLLAKATSWSRPKWDYPILKNLHACGAPGGMAKEGCVC